MSIFVNFTVSAGQHMIITAVLYLVQAFS